MIPRLISSTRWLLYAKNKREIWQILTAYLYLPKSKKNRKIKKKQKYWSSSENAQNYWEFTYVSVEWNPQSGSPIQSCRKFYLLPNIYGLIRFHRHLLPEQSKAMKSLYSFFSKITTTSRRFKMNFFFSQ